RLTDLARPERIYQVTSPDLPVDFPALRSLETRRHNLPLAVTSFVGRERELAEVAGLLAAHRLVTLTGIGGAGKTRLGLQVAADAVGTFPDGAWFVDLASLGDADLVVTEVAATLGFAPDGLSRPGESLQQRLCDQLRSRQLLLILD